MQVAASGTTSQPVLERVVVEPTRAAHRTPILFVHGMWHAAWCWREWQETLADLGWESHAISLPGHGASPASKPVRTYRMQDYLAAMLAEIRRFGTPPILIGHSMGGALAQWYLTTVADDLPGVVLVASWTSHSTIADGTLGHLRRDPWGFLQMGLTGSPMPLVRSPKWVASLLLTPGASMSPEALYARLGAESGRVLSEHNPPGWKPKAGLKSPMLWIAAEHDAVITLDGARKSAAFYGGDFMIAPEAGHDVMLEKGAPEIAHAIDRWLTALNL